MRTGSVERPRSSARRRIFAAAEGRFDYATAHFAKSVEVYKRCSLAWDEADTLHYWGRALISAGDRARAIEKLDAAVDMYRLHGAGQIWIDRVMADRQRAVSARPAAASTAGSAGASVLRKEGDYWTVSFSGETFRLKDAKGLHYLAHLLRNSGVEFGAVGLARLQTGGVPIVGGRPDSRAELRGVASELRSDLGDAGAILDSQAKADYRRRLAELREELNEAERLADLGRRERLRAAIDFLTSELAAGVGLPGMERKAASHLERARSTVSKRIRFSLGQIAKVNPALGKHLNRSVRTGYKCVYLPMSAINWIL